MNAPKPYAVIIPCPSGRVVFGNDLRSLTGIVRSHSVNTAEGTKYQSLEYSSYGMGFVPVGNTSPDIVRVGDDIQITNKRGEGEVLGRVSTDLWWVCVMDEEIFARRCEMMGREQSEFDVIRAEIGVGCVGFRIHHRDEDEMMFARMRHLDIPADFIPQREVDFGEAETFEESRIWKEVRNDHGFGQNGWAEDIFTVLGNGYNWHHGQICDLNGHDQDAPHVKDLKGLAPDDAVIDAIPPLPDFTPGVRGTTSSYPLNWGYPKLGGAPLNADKHTLALGMMVAKSLILSDLRIIGQGMGDPVRDDEKQKENKDILQAEIMAARQIAETRGLVQSGELDRIFEEILELWPRNETTPTP